MKRLFFSVAILFCAQIAKHSNVFAQTPSMPVIEPAAISASPTAAPIEQEPTNLMALGAGAFPIGDIPNYSGYESIWMLDERSDSGWSSPKGKVGPVALVVELATTSQFSEFTFDTGNSSALGSSAQDIAISVSAEKAEGPFTEILAASLEENLDGQKFPVQKQLPGRFVKVTIKNNHGSPEYTELMEIRGIGRKIGAESEAFNFSGSYDTGQWGIFRLLQNGPRVSGCYEYSNKQGKLLSAGFDGRLLRFTWEEKSSGGNPSSGPAIMVFAPDGTRMLGLWWKEGDTDKKGGTWHGKRIAKEIGRCRHWSRTGSGSDGLGESSGAGREEEAKEISSQLQTTGRIREYGILFDIDSAELKPESYQRLDEFVLSAQNNPQWKILIEGHTDSTASAAHNQRLSENRANSVRSFLLKAGIAAERIRAIGVGASNPVADNSTLIGRAQNRRVEFVRE